MSRTEQKNRAEIYCKQHTFVNIKEKLPSGKIHSYNGYILKTFEDLLEFKDRFLPHPFPILYDAIVGDIEPSEQEEEVTKE